MIGSCAPHPSPFITHIFGLVFILCIAGAEDWKCQSSPVIHKKVGEDVELSCFQGGNIVRAKWIYNKSVAAVFSAGKVTYSGQWKDRWYLNITNFSLTVKNLKPSDSGIFSFIFVTGPPLQQHPSVSFSLQVHEVLTALPVLTSNSTRDTLTRVCTVLLECSSEATGGVTYRWTVRNQTITGPSLTYTIREEDGDTVFKCSVGNIVSEVSASKVLKCVNQTGEAAADSSGPVGIVSFMRIILVCVLTVAAGIAVCVLHRRPQQELWPIRSPNTDGHSGPDHKTNLNNTDPAPPNGSDNNSASVTADPAEVEYALIFLKKSAEGGRNPNSEESAVYSNVAIQSTAGKSQSAQDETVYSEVKKKD